MLNGLYDSNKNYKNLVGGEWLSASDNSNLKIYSPIDGSMIGTIPSMNLEDIDYAIESARKAQSVWRETPMYMRAEYLYRAADLLKEYKHIISHILTIEIAKDKASAENEIERTVDFLRYTADIGKALEGTAVYGENFPGGSRDKLSYVTREPLGTVLAISPFNYPVNLSVSKIAPALMGGNTVILKPPSQGGISALYLASVFKEIGLPDGVLNTVTGNGSEIGDYLITHKGVDFINFTGSTSVGHHIAKTCGMIPIMLELGGKDAAIILDDCNLEYAAEQCVAGAFSYSGQRCTAVKRILVMDNIADQFVSLLKEKTLKLKTGSPHEDVNIVPLINDRSADYVFDLIEKAVSKGAEIITGGTRNNKLISPTVLDYVTTDMEVAWEEPFGPILPVIRVKNIEEAIAIANYSEYGLQSSVFTNDIGKAFTIARKLEVGTVQINNKTERAPDHFPFLGVKSSGMGTQGIKYSIEAMTRHKAIVVNLSAPCCNNRH